MAGLSTRTLLTLCGWTLLGLASAAAREGREMEERPFLTREEREMVKTFLTREEREMEERPFLTREEREMVEKTFLAREERELEERSKGGPRRLLKKLIYVVMDQQDILEELYRNVTELQKKISDSTTPSAATATPAAPTTPPNTTPAPPATPATPAPPTPVPPPVEIKGAVYTRWGRTSCPSDADLVYKGYAGGSWWNHQGAAVNYLCLPEQPQWAGFTDAQDSDVRNFVFGAEYQFYNRISGFDQLNQDVPCAVCQARKSTKVVMIPARTSCFPGFQREYQGYLMAGHYAFKAASEFVCVDSAPEVLPGGAANLNGKLFYFVEARCGALKCPPYVTGRELACVVCSN